MFNYTFPCGGFKTHTKMTDTGITFDPPVYEQRYCAAIQILEDSRWTGEIKKVTEFGCAEMRLFPLIRRIETIEQILQVDIDKELLKTHMCRTNPFVSDFLKQRTCPLHIEVLHGSVADSTEILKNTDAVIALELIEHVYDDVLNKIPNNIFGFIQPKMALFSTPNSDFNVIFTRFNPLMPNGFRHHDHKFEWTREEFKSWCLSITEKYPNYDFALLGVGQPPEEYKSVGFVSQIALFARKDLLDMPLVEPLNLEPVATCETPYETLHTVDFPYYVDTRTPEDKIWAEIQYELHRCTLDEDNYDCDKCAYKIAIDELVKRLNNIGASKEIVEQLLEQHKQKVEQGNVIIEEDIEEEEDNHIYTECTTDGPLSETEREIENWDE
ncbi:small RNA 2'-O-methyltransferase [Drosophila albomicans]|uniref:Small RNA 2'-O-methyltransferase n=1 Tax=Drosophila albomicans TaxID=7291 RepID=A0A6P8WZ53_DROAB|nr:small RNA 2'-O-methyltransferase [Drosophila albomicans]